MELKRVLRNSIVAQDGVLIVPFMELKLLYRGTKWTGSGVLIVPFMELKLLLLTCDGLDAARLNRTFYGIETS